ncbi:MAG TPA: NHL repeat-containing protein [Tepidisphaeraceae bacterium]|nr:NHL repeat-containing protein [Tepidisphaeraceae bacterium]
MLKGQWRWVALVIALLAMAGNRAAAGLLVSSYATNSVAMFDEGTGQYLRTFVAPGTAGLLGPTGIAWGLDGNLYVTGVQASVLRFNGTSGAFLGTFVPAGSGGLSHPVDMTFGPDGNLYISSDSDGVNAILKYDGRTGASMGQFVPSGTGGMLNPYGIAFGPDGNLYVGNFVTSLQLQKILKFDGTSGALLSVVASRADAPDGPYDLAFGSDGLLYASELYGNNIRRYNVETGTYLGTFLPSVDAGGLRNPSTLAFGPDGDLYVSANGRGVYRVNGQSGVPIGLFAKEEVGKLLSPTFMVFAPIPEPGLMLALSMGTLLLRARPPHRAGRPIYPRRSDR